MTMPFTIPGLDEVEPDESGVCTYQLSSGSLVVEAPRHYEDAAQVWAIARRYVSAVVAADKAMTAVAADKSLSHEGKRAKAQPAYEAAQRAAVTAEEAFAVFEGGLAAEEARIFAPPKLDQADLVGGLLDRELRDWVKDNPTEAAAAVRDDPKVRAAVLRSPISLGMLSDAAQAEWRKEVGAGKGEAVALIERRREAAKHARSLTYWAGKHVKEPDFKPAAVARPHGVSPGVPHAAQARARA